MLSFPERPRKMLNWILNQFKRQSAEDLERAREMVKAAERGHSHPDLGKARDVARTLGIEVDVHASAEQLIQAVRRYLARHGEL